MREDERDPPAPPSHRRRIALYRHQWIGLPVLALLPLLALAGVLGDAVAEARAAGGGVELTVRYPERERMRGIADIDMRVTNRGDAVIDTLVVRVSPSYAEQFTEIYTVPPIEGTYEFELVDVQPGETRAARFEGRAERYGRHAAEIVVLSGGRELVRLRISTRVLP